MKLNMTYKLLMNIYCPFSFDYPVLCINPVNHGMVKIINRMFT